MSWFFVAHPDGPQIEVPPEALQAAPSEVARVAERMLPRAAGEGRCRICGRDASLTRGILFFCLQANLARGFEFVKTQWIDAGTFFGTPPEMDPLVGPNDGTRMFTVPEQPIRRRLTELPRFVANRGGEYLFMPGLRALGWIADLDT